MINVGMSTNDVLQIDHVSKSFGDKRAVNELSLTIQKGEIFGFLGPNGAGKTTTIRMLLDILRPSSGSISLFGQSNYKTRETHLKIGYMSGEMVLDGDLYGKQYLNFVDYQYGSGHKHQIDDLADLLDINLNARIDSYSRGNRQKIALISALMHGPELLIMDEPTSGFDPLVQELFIDLIKEYQNGGGSVFMSSHMLSEVQHLCSRVGFIKDGSLISVKSIEELHAHSTKAVRVDADKDEVLKIKSRYKALNGLKVNSADNNTITFEYAGDMQKLLQFFGAHKIRDISINEPELEQVFLGYYNRKGT